MEILLFRHGPAGDKAKWALRGLPDFERPLTADGAKKTAKAAAGLRTLVRSLDFVAWSPLVRAAQTAACLKKEFRRAKCVEHPLLKPSAQPAAMIAALATHGPDERIALVGHEPHLSTLACLLLGAKPGALELKKAGALLLAVEGKPQAGGARLLWLLTPSQLRALR